MDVIAAVQARVSMRGLRVDEHFKDFDRLRTGRLTQQQFIRCLDQVGLQLNPEEMALLTSSYRTEDDRVDYRRFVRDVNSVFTQPNMEKAPTMRPPSGGTKRVDFGYEDPELEDLYQEVKEIVRKHCQTYGMTIRGAFKEFDAVNRGLVTLAQFQRNLPAPSDFDPVHVRVIANRFLQDGNLVNYLAFHRDVEGITTEQPLGFRQTLRKREPELVPGAGVVTTTDASELVHALQVAFYKTRVRPLEYMRDYDKLNSSYITANQFECGLSLACSAPGGLRLSREQVNALVDHFKGPDGRVNYRKFCKQTGEAFMTGKEDDLVRDPLTELPQITRHQVVTDENTLDDESEEQVQNVLASIRQHVTERNLDLYPQFRDFDRRQGFTKGVTKAQFRRLLDLTLAMTISDYDVDLICAKYLNPSTGHINYHKFIADVDEDSNLQVKESLYFDKKTIANFKTLQDVERERQEQQADLAEAINLLKARVVQRSLRAAEYLRDFDRLRKGLITPAQFKSGVKAMHPDMSAAHLNALVAVYTSPTAPPPTTVDWKKFASDMDDLLLPTRNLEKAPTIRAPDSTEVIRQVLSNVQLPPEAKGFDNASLMELEDTLEEIRHQIVVKKIVVTDYLRDFDRHHTGKITPHQFEQALDMSKLVLEPRQVKLLQLYYTVDGQVAYTQFVGDIQPSATLPNLTNNTMRGVKEVAQRREEFKEQQVVTDVNETMEKIKLNVAQRRIRIIEHLRDFDKLRKGRVTTRAFRSGLSMCGLALSLPEFRVLEQKYAAQGFPDHVDYVTFCDDVDVVFGSKHLHADPTKTSEKFLPAMDIEVEANLRKLSEEEREKGESLLASIARLVDERGIHMVDEFKDFDRVSKGAVTRTQFQRVLAGLHLLDNTPQDSIEALMSVFRIRVGGQESVHYRRFISHIERLCDDQHGERAAT
eukprot:m.112038 g.112038  ORF g.112038 m.112038 type:complete len:931 (-) comp15315_c1_seq1:1540-4332(-)